MSSKLKLAEGLALIAPFVAIGAQLLTKNGSTLQVSAWEKAVEEMEEHIQKQAWQTHMAADSEVRLHALQHYHAVYKAYEELLPLPLARWQHWQMGLRQYFGAHSNTTEATDTLQKHREALLAEYKKPFSVAFLGTSYYLLLQLSTRSNCGIGDLTTSADVACDGEGQPDENKAEGEASQAGEIQRAMVKHFTPLHFFTQLSFFSEHLFGLHGDIGKEERAWLNDVLCSSSDGEDCGETVMEALLRRSFKRDSTIPSIHLNTEFKGEYDDFEIDEKKQKEMEKRAEHTLRSQWNRNASDLFEKRTEGAQEPTRASSSFSPEENAIADSLVSEWKDAAPHRAFFFSLQRMIEYEPFPAVVNPARLEFLLFLLQRWFRGYVAQRHRWSVDHPFVAQDDADLFDFVIARHSVLLKWSLRYTQSATVEGEGGAAAEASLLIECIRTIVLSLLSCLHLYLHHPSVARANPVKANLRKQQFIVYVEQWVQATLIPTYARALLHDLNTLVDESNEEDVVVELDVGLREAELRLILCTALLSASPRSALLTVYTDTAARLMPIIDDLLSMLLEVSTAASAPATPPALRTAAAFTLLRLCKHYGQTCRYAYRVLTAQRRSECYRYLSEKWKALSTVVGSLADSNLLQLVTEEWQQFLLGQLSLPEEMETSDTKEPNDSRTHTIVEPLLWASDLQGPSASTATLLTPYAEKRRLLKRYAGKETGNHANKPSLKRTREE